MFDFEGETEERPQRSPRVRALILSVAFLVAVVLVISAIVGLGFAFFWIGGMVRD